MKRFFSLLVLLCMLPVFCSAGTGVVLCYRSYFYSAAYNDLIPGYFEDDTTIIDLYLMDDFKTAYYVKTTWTDSVLETSGFLRCTFSKKAKNTYTLTFPDASTISFHYDDEGAFWMDSEGGSVRMLESERLDIKKDLIFD